jgi:hypothetical protein
MTDRTKRRRVACGLLAALTLACVTARPVHAQQSSVPELIGDKLQEAATFLFGPRVEGPPAGLRPCGTLYGADVARIARGPELLNDYDLWIRTSLDVVHRAGGPLPLCFDFREGTLTNSQGQNLLAINNHFLMSNRASYLLTGYTDPLESDTALARRRAEEIQLKSPVPPCRYRARRGSTQIAIGQYRKVEYSQVPAQTPCPLSTR